jgi:hypothetical protein
MWNMRTNGADDRERIPKMELREDSIISGTKGEQPQMKRQTKCRIINCLGIATAILAVAVIGCVEGVILTTKGTYMNDVLVANALLAFILGVICFAGMMLVALVDESKEESK